MHGNSAQEVVIHWNWTKNSAAEQRTQLTLAFKLSYPSPQQFLYSTFLFSCFRSQLSSKAKVSLDGWPAQRQGRELPELLAVSSSAEIPPRSCCSTCTCFVLLLVLCGPPKPMGCSFFAEGCHEHIHLSDPCRSPSHENVERSQHSKISRMKV